MYDYCCPSCKKERIQELEDLGIMYCECGFTWRKFSSDIHYIVNTDKEMMIREVLEDSMEAWVPTGQKTLDVLEEKE